MAVSKENLAVHFPITWLQQGKGISQTNLSVHYSSEKQDICALHSFLFPYLGFILLSPVF